MKSSQCNVNTTMNQIAQASGAVNDDMKNLAEALNK